MGNTINANISPKAAVRLLITNEIALDSYWNTTQAETILDELYSTSVAELLRIVDFIEPLDSVNSSTLPQFGSLEMLIKVPEVLINTGMDGISYVQLGFYLKEDVNAKQSANAKYGETHGKGACQLGLIDCRKSKIHFGSLTNAFCSISDRNRQLKLVKYLCFRIPIIQTLLNRAGSERVNGFFPMDYMENSTKNRRAICLKMILRELLTLNDPELTRRINNIFWELEQEGSANAEV